MKGVPGGMCEDMVLKGLKGCTRERKMLQNLAGWDRDNFTGSSGNWICVQGDVAVAKTVSRIVLRMALDR